MKSILNGHSAASDIYPELPQFMSWNRDVILATVVSTRGSAPQKPGSSAVFDENRLIAGTVGGGMVEYSTQLLAHNALRTKTSALRDFSLSNNVSDAEGAICGGTMEILIDADPGKHTAVFEAVKKSLSEREAGVLLSHARLEPGGNLHIEREWITRATSGNKPVALPAEVAGHLHEMLTVPKEGDFRRKDFQEPDEKEKQTYILETVVPVPRLLIAGAGHVGKALSHLGKLLGFEVMVWDYRSEYATRENLPDADIILSGNIHETLAGLTVDRNTYVVAVTSGHKHDMEVLKLFTGSPAGYLGMIGSRKKTILVREQFLAEGWATEEQWKKIYAPVGLDIHSQTVEEIAVSIAAQLIQVRHQINRIP